MKKQHIQPKKPTPIDISKQPYDHLLQNLKNWKIKDNQTIITTLESLLKYKYSGITQLKMIANFVSQFHKDICRVNQKQIDDQSKVEVHPIFFQKIIQLKAKLVKLQKQGCFEGQKVIKSKMQQLRKKKKNLVNVQVTVPQVLMDKEKQEYHRNNLKQLYRSFVSYYPEAHSEQPLNIKLIEFLSLLYDALKKRFFYLKQKENFTYEIQKLCSKLNKSKYLQNKKKMISGEIKIKDIVMNRSSVFENFTAKRKEQQEMRRILKQSQIQYEQNDKKEEEIEKPQSPLRESNQNLQQEGYQ